MIRKTRYSEVAGHDECAHDHQKKVKGSLVKKISMKARWKGAGTTGKMWEREERSSLATRRIPDLC